MTEEVGIRTLGYFIIGLPKDTKQTIKETVDLLFELDPDFVNFAILTLYPQTEIYELAIREGVAKRIQPKEIFKPQAYKHPLLSRKELEGELSKIYKKFYMRPHYLLRRFFRIRTFNEFKSNLISGLPFLKPKVNSFNISKRFIPLEREIELEN